MCDQCVRTARNLMHYCDHHGWMWEPGQGPSPCIGETASWVLALSTFLFASFVIRLGRQRTYGQQSYAQRVHAIQIVLSMVQAVQAVVGGLLAARSRTMLCVALALHSGSWAIAWGISALALQRTPRSSRHLLWFWCFALVSNSVVLSSLRHASEASGRDLPVEIGCLSWMSFFGNAMLVVLQLTKPELGDDTNSVYIRVVDRDGVVSSAAASNGRGWQAFWAGGGGDAFGAHSATGDGSIGNKAATRTWCCFGCRHGSESGSEGGGAWPIAGGGRTLNESLLGTSSFDERTGIGGAPQPKAKEASEGSGCFHRLGNVLCFLFGNGTKGKGSAAAAAAESMAADHEEGLLRGQDSPFERSLRAGGASSFPSGAAIGARAPPQVAAPVFGVAVSRWRLVGADGVPSAHGSSGDALWTEGLHHGSTSSVRTAALSGADLAASMRAEGQRSRDHHELSPASGPAAPSDFDGDRKARAGCNGREPLRVEFELLVRASGRGEMDWWGRGESGGGGTAAVAATDGDWRLWRSAADTLALYDALALRFGQEFIRRVSRPNFKTHKKHVRFAVGGSDDGLRSPPASSSRDSAPPLLGLPGPFHRVDILSDAKKIGAFLRSLMGLRQFLSTAVMDFLAQPPPQEPLPSEATPPNGDGSSDTSDAGYVTSDDFLEEESGAAGGAHARAGAGAGSSSRFGPGGKSDRDDGGASAGQAVAVAALATDYGAWLKRLAVRLRRATPAGDRFVRLRCIGPAVTGEQVVWWLFSSSGECDGDRATAVRLGQDLVSHGLLTPVCAGYDRPEGSAGSGGGGGDGHEKTTEDLFGSFDDAAGWLFAFEGDALRNPFAPPPPIQVSVMAKTGVEVGVTGWVETPDEDGTHVSFIVHTHVEATQEAWDSPRRYREFTQLRKRLLRLGIDIPTSAAGTRIGAGGGGGTGGEGGGLTPDLPKKTWRMNKFDAEHLETRRAALEAYLRAAVKGALAAPHLSGHLVMRFLDPDESRLRILSELRSKNPFGKGQHHQSSSARISRGAAGAGRGGERAACGGSNGDSDAAGRDAGDIRGGQGEKSVGNNSREDQAEEEDFETLADSIGGFV